MPAPGGGTGGSGHHTDPGPNWSWRHYLALVRRYAHGVKLSVVPGLRRDRSPGSCPGARGRPAACSTVEFVVDGRVVWTDRRPPFAVAGGRGLNTTRLANGPHVLELRAYGDGTRHDIARRTVVVDNRAFRLTTAGAREWTRVKGTVRLRARAWGAKARSVVLRVDGRVAARDSRAPFAFRWNTRRVKDRKHLLELEARSVDGRVATRRIALVVRNRRLRPPRPARPVPTRAAAPHPRAERHRRHAGRRPRDLARLRAGARRAGPVHDRRHAPGHRPGRALHARLGHLGRGARTARPLRPCASAPRERPSERRSPSRCRNAQRPAVPKHPDDALVELASPRERDERVHHARGVARARRQHQVRRPP